jgi:prevent-host-death family protein
MKTVSIDELRERTGDLVREAVRHGEIIITDGGEPIAKIVAHQPPPKIPYFARRKLNPEYLAIVNKLTGGTDSTIAISEDREDRVK